MDAKKLFNKKAWTGEETGKALILDLIYNYQQSAAGNPRPKPLFPREKLSEMLYSFRDSARDIEFYNRYANLQNWIMQYQAVANASLQRFQACVHEFISIHNAAESAENEYRYIEQLPRIVTQKQYDELKARRIEEALDPKGDGTDARGVTLFGLIARVIALYAQALEANPKKANPLKAIKKRYQEQPVKDKWIIAAYNHAAGEGYYQLPNGTRSDKVTEEEWHRQLYTFSPELKRLIEEGEEGRAGEEGTLSFERITKAARAAHMGEPEPEAKEGAAVWHTYEDAPEGLTKWDIIDFCIDNAANEITGINGAELAFAELFPAVLPGMETEDPAQQAAAFNKEFPELVKAALKELNALGITYKGKPVTSAPSSEWTEIYFTWRELYNMDFPGFRAEIESDLNIFDGDTRALVNGVAILRPSDLIRKGFCLQIDEKGYYKEPHEGALFSDMFGLNAYLPDNPESGDNIDHIERTRADLKQTLRFLIGYDTALELIAKEIQIPDFTLFNAMSQQGIERVEALNRLFDLLYTHIEEINYRDQERKAAKLQALRDLFYPIDTKALAIPESRKKKAAAMLEELEAFGEGKSGNSPGWDFLGLLTQEGGGDE